MAASYVPVMANYALSAKHAGITRIVLFIHDASRDAKGTLNVLRTLAGPSESKTMIAVPQFLIDADLAAVASSMQNRGALFARWPYGVWETGGDSTALPPAHGISSFTAMDMMLMYFSEKSLFPDVQQIVVAGMGAGGNFVQRYAAIGRAPDILAKQNVPLRFVVADATSYLYLTPSRFRGGNNGFGILETQTCPDYNAWPHGLDQLNPYGKRIGANAAKLSYNLRRVSYLLGAITNAGAVDADCGAFLQGKDEHARMAIYALYLKSIYGEDVAERHVFNTIPEASYNAASLFGSSCGLASLFGDGVCTPPPMTGTGNRR